MPLAIVIVGILLLVLLIGYFKINAFIAFVVVSIGIGLAEGMPAAAVSKAVQTGIGNILGFLVIILGFGAMLGKLVADSGAAQRISTSLINAFGVRYIHWALVLTGFIVGIPLFYSVGFVILVPLVFTVAAINKLPLIYVGLPMLSALSVTHGYLPPHPAPSAIVQTYGADLGLTLVYGLIIAVPAIILGGPVFASTLKKYNPKPLEAFFNTKELSDEEMPSLGISIFTALLPVLLLAVTAVLRLFVPEASPFGQFLAFVGDPIIAMLITILVAIFTLGIMRGKSMLEVGKSLEEGIKGIAMILLIIAGAGALKQILVESEVSAYIAGLLQGLDTSPLILAWGIAAIIRVCVGSATVAGLTSAGIVLPLIVTTGADPNLMVLATGAGSLMFSHVNDSGFWMFKEFFNLSITDTIKTWSAMETIVSVVGLIGVLILDQII
ncbi:gluconate:H+ symporter [Flavilitoribacter nigricans]|uniref:Gluconate transporter n=1 Tax=Flavilitoribacter nigricans (strain ATCC 23147 / DSM 23189 / NBRC 102662 / NCIMB 1420 / SS-2) TaxID=1122177 RepID=A0A2D0N617_FLAN2|nr:gluconate:H+ symporter [Flavilitoribacter nigricans]PHN03972.1 gluconate transporter [Flavilitoribacter nigricans DSM 23189 = NBRC 102662]